MNKENLRYLFFGLLLGALSLRLAQLSWSSNQEMMKGISNVDGVHKAVGADTNNTISGVSTAAASAPTQLKTSDEITVQVPNSTTKDGEGPKSSSGTNAKLQIKDFVHHPGAVIAVKIHGGEFLPELQQALCLLQVAYNNRVLYDIVVFATIALPEEGIAELRQIVHPAKLIVQYDEQTLQEQIADMTPTQQEHLMNRCYDVNRTEDLTWHHRCKDGKFVMPIAYCWMSEFRSKQIWTQKVLAPYKYMLWYDSDAFATQVWKKDPIAFMIREDLVLLMANYAQGTTLFKTGVQSKLFQVYNKTFCGGEIQRNGRLNVTYGGEHVCRSSVKQVHGFFHITNLDFYRLPINLHWSNVQIGDNKFSRLWDDQLAVAVPPTMLAPHRVAEMEISGLKLEVMHNGMIMGKRKWIGGAYKKFFRTEGVTKFPEAQNKCKALVKVSSR